MQGSLNDKLSDELAIACYKAMLAGKSLGESLRQARFALRQHPRDVGLLVGYTARDGWLPLSLQPGTPQVDALGLPR